MASEQQILEVIRKVITDDIGIKVEYDPNSSLLRDGVMDSMDWISFLTVVEEKFGIEISPEDANKHSIAVPSNLVRYLLERLD